MTSIITIKRRHEIVILTDGLGRRVPDGRTFTIAKCAMCPRAPALIASRGEARIASLTASDGFAHSFDDLVREGATMLAHYFEKIGGLVGFAQGLGQEEITLAGWSEKEQRLATYFFVPDDRYLSRGIEPFTLVEQTDEITMAPGPLTDEQAAAIHCPPADAQIEHLMGQEPFGQSGHTDARKPPRRACLAVANQRIMSVGLITRTKAWAVRLAADADVATLAGRCTGRTLAGAPNLAIMAGSGVLCPEGKPLKAAGL